LTNLFPSATLSSKCYYVNKDRAGNYGNTEYDRDDRDYTLQGNKKKAELILQAAMNKSELKIKEAEREAGVILKKAEEEREKIKEEAAKEGVLIRKKAEEKGYTEGFARGRKDGEEYVKSVMEEMKKLIFKGLEDYRASVKELEPEIVDLSIAIAESIIRHKVSSYSRMAFDQAAAALIKLNDRSKVTIRASKLDLEHLNNYREHLIALQDDIKELVIVEDLRVEEGGCIVETPSGTVDARLPNQLSEIKNAFSKTLECETEE